MMDQVSSNALTWRLKIGGLFLTLFSLFLWGCVSGQMEKNKAAEAGITKVPPTLVSLDVSRNGQEVILTGNQMLSRNYTAVKAADFSGVVVYLTGTGMGDGMADIFPEAGPIQSVTAGYVGEDRSTVKVAIRLKRPLAFEVAEEGKRVRLIFPAASPAVGNDAAKSALDQEEDANSFVVGADDQGNTVIFTREDIPFNTVADKPQDVEVAAQSADASMVGNLSNSPTVFPERTTLKNIQFTLTKAGESLITVDTIGPVKYDLQKGAANQLKLLLYNTQIPSRHQRPLITTYFNSAVEQVLPVASSGAGQPPHILIDLRHKVPYRITREGARLHLVFDPASVTVPKFKQARVVVNDGVVPSMTAGTVPGHTDRHGNMTSLDTSVAEPAEQALSAANAASPAVGKTGSPVDSGSRYTGEKISLDFYETDIKNVFRILKTVSGENFAVDKDVTGNVTLALENPVPWDQVLDLVLKMNGLGKVREDGILRIATKDTLKKEYEQEQEALAAKQKALAQKEKLEPLVTEYIPINYSSAEVDIKPHLEKLLTPERGQLSVDARTNMIIITDVRLKIDQAKELINRLDMVTPQIMIAARVVEVSKNFSRELGIEWGMSSQDVYRDDLGGTYGFDVAMNYPAASDSSISYTFNRLTGTPFSINARLTAAESRGDVKIVSSPRILTLDNKKATITQGLEYPYQVVEDDEVSTEFKDIDLKLEVTPHVTPDRRVSMEVAIEKSDITDFAITGEPVISKNEAATELLVNDGNTIVIGGVVKRTTSDDTNGFPILSGIPILGHLFKTDSKGDSKNELLIFLTPTIVQLDQKKVLP